jgi:hypothetical protein
VKPRTSMKPFTTKQLCLVVLCLAGSWTTAVGQGGVIIRENVPADRKDELVAKLRSITGLPQLSFSDAGALEPGHEHLNGSEVARALLAQAISGSKVIVIEDASSRFDIAFCRVVPGRWRSGVGTRSSAFVVLIDFADFKQLSGDSKARAAFDVGWGFLHELDHVIADSKDGEDPGSLGDCESHINQMRSELGLPVRVGYFFTDASLRTDPNFTSKFVRLPFESYDSQNSRKHRYWLVWDSTSVGGLVTSGQTAVVR